MNLLLNKLDAYYEVMDTPMELQLKFLGEEFDSVILGWLDDPQYKEFFRRWPHPINRGSSKVSALRLGVVFLGIFKGGGLIGVVSMGDSDVTAKKIEFGLLIDFKVSPYRGTVAVEAVDKTMDYLFNHLNYHKAYCIFLEHRKECKALLAGNKLTYEGTLRDNIFWEGQYHNEVVYSMLKAEYNKIKQGQV